MSLSSVRRVLGSLRRYFRRRRVPGPTEQQWLRLILLVRRLQHGQLAFATRLDEIRALTGQLGSFRSDFGALHEQLDAARETAGELERGLSERLSRLDGLPDPVGERAALDLRLSALDTLAGRLERLAGQAPVAALPQAEVGALLGRLGELASRFEASADSERAVGGEEELAQLYDRIQELAEGLALPRVEGASTGGAGEGVLALISEQLEQLATTVADLAAEGRHAGQDELLERLERLAARFEARPPRRAAPGPAPEELIPLVARLEALALRLEQAPGAVPLSSEALIDDTRARELDGLRIQLACEQESRRRVDEELEGSRSRLRASELARVELETRHTTEMAQLADHVGRQLQRVEDDLKKKKRGLAELTQQNIELQSRLNQLQQGAAAAAPGEDEPEPPPPLPRKRKAAAERPEKGTGKSPEAGAEPADDA
jgi:hypothetical protein